MYIRVEREKKNMPRILTKFGGVVGSLLETIQKKFELHRQRGRRAGRSLRTPSSEKKTSFFFRCNLSFYTSLNQPHPSQIKTHSFTQGSKSCRSLKSSFYFSKKNAIKDLLPQIRAEKIFRKVDLGQNSWIVS